MDCVEDGAGKQFTGTRVRGGWSRSTWCRGMVWLCPELCDGGLEMWDKGNVIT